LHMNAPDVFYAEVGKSRQIPNPELFHMALIPV